MWIWSIATIIYILNSNGNPYASIYLVFKRHSWKPSGFPFSKKKFPVIKYFTILQLYVFTCFSFILTSKEAVLSLFYDNTIGLGNNPIHVIFRAFEPLLSNTCDVNICVLCERNNETDFNTLATASYKEIRRCYIPPHV